MSSPFGVSATVRYWVHQDSFGLSEAELALLEDPQCKKPEHKDPPVGIPENETDEQMSKRVLKRNMHDRLFGWNVHPIFGQFNRDDKGRYDETKHTLPAYPPEWYYFQAKLRFNPVSCEFEVPAVFQKIEALPNVKGNTSPILLVTAAIWFATHEGVVHAEGRYFTSRLGGCNYDDNDLHYAFLHRKSAGYWLGIAVESLKDLNEFYRRLRIGELSPRICFSPGVVTSTSRE